MHSFLPLKIPAILKPKSNSVCPVNSVSLGLNSSTYCVWCVSSMFLALLKYWLILGWLLTFSCKMPCLQLFYVVAKVESINFLDAKKGE